MDSSIVDLCDGNFDFTIKSKDGIKFLVSKYVICMYSPTLCNLLEGTKETMIDINENNETIKWVLMYIFNDLKKKKIILTSITPEIYRLCFSWDLIIMNEINQLLISHIKSIKKCNEIDKYIVSDDILRNEDIAYAFVFKYINGGYLHIKNKTLMRIIMRVMRKMTANFSDYTKHTMIKSVLKTEFNKSKLTLKN